MRNSSLVFAFCIFSVAITAETAIIILYATAAVVPITQLAPDPLSAAILAHGAQVVAANINVAARLRIAAHGNKPSASACTLEPAIIVNNIANALVEPVE